MTVPSARLRARSATSCGLAFIGACAALCCASTTASAEPVTRAGSEHPTSMWRDEWPQFGALEGFFTASAVLGMVVFEVAGGPAEPRWKGGILFDDDVRGAIRARERETRESARTAGDVIYYTFPVIPVVVDSFVLTLLVRRDDKAALNLFFVSGEALAYSGLLSFAANAVSARQRPDARACGARCEDGAGQSDDFYSGHTAMASASAGVVCASHVFMPLWGHPAADATACALASSAAVATGVTRLVADRHYFSDVFVGTMVGFGIGFAVPTLLHYRVPGGPVSITAVPGAPSASGGMSIGGTF